MTVPVAVTSQGRIVEPGVPAAVYRDPQHDDTRALLAVHPEPDPRRRAVATDSGT